MKNRKNSQEKNDTATMIPREKLKKMRTEILDDFSMIEHGINVIISNHYLGETKFDFAIEVLHDEQFSYALRRNILEKILRKRGLYNDSQFQNFHRLGKIRNKFAHLGTPLVDHRKRKIRYPDSQFPDRDVDYEKLYDDFKKRSDAALHFFLDTFKKMGISNKKK